MYEETPVANRGQGSIPCARDKKKMETMSPEHHGVPWSVHHYFQMFLAWLPDHLKRLAEVHTVN